MSGGDLSGHRDLVIAGLGQAASDVMAGIKFVPPPPPGAPLIPDTATRRLESARNDLQSALAALSAVPAPAHGGFVETAEEAVRLALAEAVESLTYVTAHPESDLLSRSRTDMTFTPVDAPRRPVYAVYSVGISKDGPANFIFDWEHSDPNVNQDLLRAFFYVHNSFYVFLPAPEQLPHVGPVGGHRDGVMSKAITAMNAISLALDYAHSHPALPDTAEGRLLAVQAAVQKAFAVLRRESLKDHGGHLETARAGVEQTLADVAEAIAHVRAKPALNPLPTATQPAAKPVTVHGTGSYDSASGVIASYYAGRFPAMLEAQKSLDEAIAMLSNVALSDYTGPVVGELDGFRDKILAGIRQVAAEVVAGANFPSEAANTARRAASPAANQP